MAFVGTGDTTWRTIGTVIISTISTTTTATIDAIRWLWTTSTVWLTDRIATVAAVMPLLRDGWDAAFRPSILLVKARAFIDRLAHRELRRRAPSGWISCPSI